MEKAPSWNFSTDYRYLGKAKSWLTHSSEHKSGRTGLWYHENFAFSNLVSVQAFVDPYVGIRIFPSLICSCKRVTIFFYVYVFLYSWFAHLFFNRSLFLRISSNSSSASLKTAAESMLFL